MTLQVNGNQCIRDCVLKTWKDVWHLVRRRTRSFVYTSLIHTTSWVLDEAISSWYCQLRCGSSRWWHGLQRVVKDELDKRREGPAKWPSCQGCARGRRRKCGVIYVVETVFWRGGMSNWTARLQVMPDVLVTLQQKSAGVCTTDGKKRCDTMKKWHWDARTHARRVCMPLCTARCGVKQSLATTRYPLPCARSVEVESTLSYRVLCEDWRVCILSYCIFWGLACVWY